MQFWFYVQYCWQYHTSQHWFQVVSPRNTWVGGNSCTAELISKSNSDYPAPKTGMDALPNYISNWLSPHKMWVGMVPLRKLINLSKFQVIFRRSCSVGMVYSGYGYGSLAELTEVPGTGMEVLQNSQKFRVRHGSLTWLTEVPGRY